MRRIRIGSRDSRLAVLQAEIVMQAIHRAHPELTLELVTMKTTGDKILHKTLDQIGGKGLFVKELDQALREKRVDLTVHSCKDLPMDLPEDLPVVALTAREDPRDVLVLPRQMPRSGAPYGTASRRRALQLPEAMASDENVEIQPVRGNVLTRLEKLDRGEYRALVLAAAGLKRMGLTDRISRYFTTEEMIPAACQGILAVQGRADEHYDFLESVNSPESWVMYRGERSFVAALDGGCSSPTAACVTRTTPGKIQLTGLYYDEDKAELRRGQLQGTDAEAEELGRRLAQQLRSKERRHG